MAVPSLRKVGRTHLVALTRLGCLHSYMLCKFSLATSSSQRIVPPLSVFGKLWERLMTYQITWHIGIFGPAYVNQFSWMVTIASNYGGSKRTAWIQDISQWQSRNETTGWPTMWLRIRLKQLHPWILQLWLLGDTIATFTGFGCVSWPKQLIDSLKPSEDDQTNDLGVDPPQEVQSSSSSALNQDERALRNRFCKWDWALDEQQYNWSSVSSDHASPKKWPHSQELWARTVDFLGHLKWRTGDCAVSIYCIAFLFWIRTKIIPPTLLKGTEGTFHLMVQWIRQVLKELKKLKVEIYPSSVNYCVRSTMHASQYCPCGTSQKDRGVHDVLWKDYVGKVCGFPPRGR